MMTSVPFVATARAPLGRAEHAARLWRVYSGGRVTGEARADADGATLQVIRAEAPSEVLYPSLVDPSLLWLVLEVAAPGAPLVELRWRADGSVQAAVDLGLPAPAMPGIERTAKDIVFEATMVAPPRVDHLEIGRGAWEQAGYVAEAEPCSECPFALASNLDCETCRRVVLGRKTFSQWSRARVAEGLRALDFDPDLASMVALETGFVLAQVRAPTLSHAFFDQWALRFADRTRELFSNDEDLAIARDLIEAQMVQPWFRPPPFADNPTRLPLPPPLDDAIVSARARHKVHELTQAGVPRWQAERRVQASLQLRQLLAAEGELMVERLGRGHARILGDLDRLVLAIGEDGEEPWIVEVATALGRSVDLRRGLHEDERERLAADLELVHRRLIDAIAHERRALNPEGDARAIALALENLRGEIGGPAPFDEQPPPSAEHEEEKPHVADET